jgi:hypothetical protein
MNDRFFTPVFGSIIGFISFQTIESWIATLFIAFLSGIMAWLAKYLMNSFVKFYKAKKAKND